MKLTKDAIENLLDWLSERTIPNGDGCHEYTGTITSKGYPNGGKTIRGKQYQPHVIAAIIATGRLPNKGDDASHLCHNKSCVNPLHLTFESRSKNSKRSSEVFSNTMRKIYEDPAELARHREAMRNRAYNKLTMEDAREIRRLYATGKYSYLDLATLYGCSKSQIASVINNKQWRE